MMIGRFLTFEICFIQVTKISAAMVTSLTMITIKHIFDLQYVFIYRLTEEHKTMIRVIRKIKFFVARRKFQVGNKKVTLMNCKNLNLKRNHKAWTHYNYSNTK